MEDVGLFSGGLIGTLVIVGLSIIALYFARTPIHTVIEASCRALAHGLRFVYGSIMNARTNLVARNREVLLAQGREAASRMVEREFERYGDAVRREIGQYPTLHQGLSERARKLDEEYAASTATPPSPPGWAEAVDAVSGVPAKADPVLRQVLESIHGSFKKAANEANEAYRNDYRGRHKILNEMAPNWRDSLKLLSEVKARFDTVNERASAVERSMQKYEEMDAGEDKAAAALQSSALVQFFVAGLVLAVAFGGAIVNFHLIARPMSEMVGGTSYIGTFRTADIAALVIILVELSMGLFVMECLRITNLLPVVSALSDRVRRRLAMVAFAILLSLACVEAGLAYMRELLLVDELATTALLRGDAGGASSSFLWITTAAQMGMGFILPFALTFVAIPLETFVHSLRAVLGWIAAALLLAMSFIFNLLARLCDEADGVLTGLYDVAIFAPLWVENRLGDRRAEKASAVRQSKPVGAKAILDDAEQRLAS